MIFMDETKKVDFISDKWISLRTSGFVNLLVRRTSRFFDEIRAMFNGEGGGASRNIVLLIFKPTHFIVDFYDQK